MLLAKGYPTPACCLRRDSKLRHSSISGIFSSFSATLDRKVITITVAWAVIALISVPFSRIHDDEVVYFVQSGLILHGNLLAHSYLVFLPQLLGTVFVAVFNSIAGVRILSSVAVLFTSFFIYFTRSDRESFASSMLFLFSFYTLRFGFRFYLDPFGTLFVILAIYFLYKQNGFGSGMSSAAAVFSRQLAAPLVVILGFVAYRKKIKVWKFVLGALIVLILGALFVFFSHGSANVLSFYAGVASSIPVSELNNLASLPESWVELIFLSPLLLLGILFSGKIRKRPEFYPIVFSAIILTFTPGFLINGGATEYPYIFNAIACLPAGSGLCNIYDRLGLGASKFTVVILAVLIATFLVQSYLATALSPNGVVGVQDFGYWDDMALLSYLNAHYDGGKIYGSNLDGLLSQKLSGNWVWTPQSIEPALRDNPPWLVTFRSYVRINSIPSSAEVKEIGPFVVINSAVVPLSSFVSATNVSEWRLW